LHGLYLPNVGFVKLGDGTADSRIRRSRCIEGSWNEKLAARFTGEMSCTISMGTS